jgi:hypothetical protein
MTDDELERALLDKIMKLGFGDRRDAALTQPGRVSKHPQAAGAN